MSQKINPLNRHLHPDHAGIAGWSYVGNLGELSNLRPELAQPLFEFAGELATKSIKDTYGALGLRHEQCETPYYQAHLSRSPVKDRQPGRWFSLITPLAAGLDTLYYAQLQLHLDAIAINRKVGSEFVRLCTAEGISRTRGGFVQLINHVPAVRVLKKVRADGIGTETPNTDAWVPEIVHHGPGF